MSPDIPLRQAAGRSVGRAVGRPPSYRSEYYELPGDDWSCGSEPDRSNTPSPVRLAVAPRADGVFRSLLLVGFIGGQVPLMSGHPKAFAATSLVSGWVAARQAQRACVNSPELTRAAGLLWVPEPASNPIQPQRGCGPGHVFRGRAVPAPAKTTPPPSTITHPPRPS